jgi:hypothetical protein
MAVRKAVMNPRGPRRALKSTRPEIIKAALRILRASPYAMTIRQVYYQLVVTGVVENIRQEYKRTCEALKQARDDDIIPHDWIVDHTRTYVPPAHGWERPEDYLAYLARSASSYTADQWNGQDRVVIGICEKDAMTDVLDTLAGELDDTFPRVRFTAARGFSSLSLVHIMAKSIQEESQQYQPTLLYFGDFDPSGEGMCTSPYAMHVLNDPGDLVRRLRKEGCRDFETVKVALTHEQFQQWFDPNGLDRLPYDPNPIKDTDSRAGWYRELYGDKCAELDAVPIDRLRTLLVDHLTPLIDRDAYQRVLARQARDRARLEQALANLTLPPMPDADAGR